MSADLSAARRWLPGLWEVALAVVAVALSIRVLAGADVAPGFRAADVLAYVLTGIGAGAVVLARRQPLLALLVAGVCSTALAWRDYHVDVLPFLVTGLLFMVASYRPRRAAVLGLACAVGLLGVTAATRPADLGPSALGQSLAIFTTAWALGRLTRGRREALLSLVAVAEQRAAAERDRTMLAQVEERLRIARELHDVLAHSISVISVQATVGEHLAGGDPVAAKAALVTIGEVSRSSMQELRQILMLLRDDSALDSADAVSYEPARGLGDLDALVETYRSVGLPVQMSTSGNVRGLSPSADLCAYRIVQEALTNTLKHAGPGTASVALMYGPGGLEVVISDDGRGADSTVGGHGLVGMRERTALLGGRLVTGRGPAGGFSVTATIPYEQAG